MDGFVFITHRFVSFLLRTAHDKATGKEGEDPEITMKAQIKQLVAQIEIGQGAKQEPPPEEYGGGVAPRILQRRAMRAQEAIILSSANAASGW